MDESIGGEVGSAAGEGAMRSPEPPRSIRAQQIPRGAGSGHAFAFQALGMFQ